MGVQPVMWVGSRPQPDVCPLTTAVTMQVRTVFGELSGWPDAAAFLPWGLLEWELRTGELGLMT